VLMFIESIANDLEQVADSLRNQANSYAGREMSTICKYLGITCAVELSN